jgi:hypothetical protein
MSSPAPAGQQFLNKSRDQRAGAGKDDLTASLLQPA